MATEQQTKKTSFGTVDTIDWGQNFDTQWFIKLNQNDKIKFRNVNPYTLKVDEENDLFVKLQYMTNIV